jgi:predicted O-methyltransferase YrrM
VEYVRTRHHDFEQIAASEHLPGNAGIAAEQLMALYRAGARHKTPTILELGAERGASATAFLQACVENDGSLVSVDVEDCSAITDHPRWTFVRSDSRDVGAILEQAPVLARGIDVLYVDSLHTPAHVRQEIDGWWPYMRAGSFVFLDDVDPAPYRAGQRKDSFTNERNWSLIQHFILAFFYGNMNEARLDISYGSTGLATLRKLSPMGTVAGPPNWGAVKARRDVLEIRYTFARARSKLL